MGIGRKLTDILIEKGMNTNELAQRIGVTPSTIYSIIQRDSNRIDIDLIIKISRALGITADDLLVEELKPLHPNHKMHLELLENNHIYGRLLDAAAGCTDEQINAAINLLNAFTNPDSYIYNSSTPHN